MFKRLVLDHWTLVMPILAFAFTASVFLYVTIRSICMSKSRREELAQIPFDEPK